MKVIPASASHSDLIASFQVKMALETENLVLDPITVGRGVKAVFDNPEKGAYYIAVDENGAVAGCLLTTYEWSDWRNGSVLWIQSVYVIPEFRGKRIFSLLYLHIKSMVEKSDAFSGIRLYVDNTNLNAQEVYKAVGMNG